MEEETKNASTETEKVVAAIEEKKEEKIEEKKTEEVAKNKKKCIVSDFCKKYCKNKGAGIAVAVLVILIAISYGVKVYRDNQKADIGSVAIKAKVQKFVDANVPAGTTASIKDITKDGNLYKVDITVGTQDVVTYVASDGSKLFSGVADLNAASAPAAANNQQAQTQQPVPKTDKPDVRLFVMSYCPYGTQEEKGLLPAITALGNKVNFTLEFVDYSMHNSLAQNDRKELDENMRQYCIQKNQPAALNSYLTCFLKKGQGTEASCMATAGVNAAQVTTCMAQTDTQFNVTKDYNDQSSYSGGQFPIFEINKADNTKYGVQGSPTLVINGVQADSAGRDSASILKTICSAFNNQPKECQTQLSSTPGAPGFGEGAAPASAGTGAACATPQQ